VIRCRCDVGIVRDPTKGNERPPFEADTRGLLKGQKIK
jgi:hypothetical protein